MERRGGAGKIVNFIDLDIERKANIVPHEFKMGVVEEMEDVFPGSRKEIIDAENFMALFKEALT